MDVKLHTLRSFFLFPTGAMKRKRKLGSLKTLLCPYNNATLIANLQQWRLPSHFLAIRRRHRRILSVLGSRPPKPPPRNMAGRFAVWRLVPFGRITSMLSRSERTSNNNKSPLPTRHHCCVKFEGSLIFLVFLGFKKSRSWNGAE